MKDSLKFWNRVADEPKWQSTIRLAEEKKLVLGNYLKGDSIHDTVV